MLWLTHLSSFFFFQNSLQWWRQSEANDVLSGAKKMLIPTKTEPAFLLPILTLLELEMKVAKLERSLIQFDVFKWSYDKWIQGMQVFCVNFCKIFPVLQFDVVLLIIFNCEIVSVNLGVDFVPSSCLKTKYFVLPLFFCSYSYLFWAVLMSREAFSSDAKLRQYFILSFVENRIIYSCMQHYFAVKIRLALWWAGWATHL